MQHTYQELVDLLVVKQEKIEELEQLVREKDNIIHDLEFDLDQQEIGNA